MGHLTLHVPLCKLIARKHAPHDNSAILEMEIRGKGGPRWFVGRHKQIEDQTAMMDFAPPRNSAGRNQYTDKILESHCWNEFLLWINTLNLFLYRNVVNLALESESTTRLRETSMVGGEPKLQHPINQLATTSTTLNSALSFGVPLTGVEPRVSSHRDRSQSQGATNLFKRYYKRPPLQIPNKSLKAYLVALFLEMLFVLRYAAIYFLLSPMNSSTTKLTCTKSMIIGRFVPDLLLKPSSTPSSTTLELSSCSPLLNDSSFESYVHDRYKGFRLWNISTNVFAQQPSFVTDYLFVEIQGQFQLIKQETQTVATILGTVVFTIGIAGSIISGFKPLDIPTLAFLYEPNFCSYRIRLRLGYYLDLIRYSYLNYVAATETDEQTSSGLGAEGSQKFRGNCTVSDSDQESHLAPLDEDDNVIMITNLFRDYIPAARRQAWRARLLVAVPVMEVSFIISGCTFVMFVFMLYINSNVTAIALNHDLKQTLDGSRVLKVYGDQFTLTESCPTINESSGGLEAQVDGRVTREFRQMLTRRLGPYVGVTKLEDLASSLAPVRPVDYSNWIVPFLSLCCVVLLISIHMTQYLISITDLCLWLVEMQVKLTVNRVILNERSQQYQPANQQLAGAKDYQTRLVDIATSCCDDDQEDDNDDYSINIKLIRLFEFWRANREVKDCLCRKTAHRLMSGRNLPISMLRAKSRRASDKFLMSTYLDIRLFQDEIVKCHSTTNFIICFILLQGLNLIVNAIRLHDPFLKIGIVCAVIVVTNVFLLAASFFQTQCKKLQAPIYQILAASTTIESDRKTKHLALLWRKCLLDMNSGVRTKFAFKVGSIPITYATTLQVS